MTTLHPSKHKALGAAYGAAYQSGITHYVARSGQYYVVLRWEELKRAPAENANPTMDTFDIDRDHCGPMVLDALVKINDQIRHWHSGGLAAKGSAAPAR
jgi:hypothetical protein